MAAVGASRFGALLHARAQPTRTSPDKETLLYMAAVNGRRTEVVELLRAGADHRIRVCTDLSKVCHATARDAALQRGYRQIVQTMDSWPAVGEKIRIGGKYKGATGEVTGYNRKKLRNNTHSVRFASSPPHSGITGAHAGSVEVNLQSTKWTCMSASAACHARERRGRLIVSATANRRNSASSEQSDAVSTVSDYEVPEIFEIEAFDHGLRPFAPAIISAG